MPSSAGSKKGNIKKRGSAKPAPLMYSYYYNAKTRTPAPVRQSAGPAPKKAKIQRQKTASGNRFTPALFVMIALIIGVVTFKASHTGNNSSTDPKVKGARTTFNKAQYSSTDPASLWAVVNKKRPLPDTFVPAGLRVLAVTLRLPSGDEEMSLAPVAADAVEKLVTAAGMSGIQLMLGSGYRSINRQSVIYNESVEKIGQEATDAVSAKPGTSEHHTGLAVDFDAIDRKCEFQQCFDETSEYAWLSAHAYEYGFIMRYTKDKVAVTGYSYEPWHYRYVGIDLAKEMHTTGVKTLEEFFSLN